MSALVLPRHVIVINSIAMQETVEEEEVLRRLGTREEAGLTEAEAARRLRLHGPNVVVRSQHVRQPPQSIPPPPTIAAVSPHVSFIRGSQFRYFCHQSSPQLLPLN